MKNSRVIAVWGNPNSGKTSFSVKLALELAKQKKNVTVIFCDTMIPTLSTVLPFVEVKSQSLGAVLSAVSISQESILQNSIPLKSNKYLSFLSYLHGENDRSYAKYTKERVVDLMILLKHLSDYVIIDCSNRIQEDLLTSTALEIADQVIRLVSPDLKAISYFDSCLPMLREGRYKVDKHLLLLSKVKPEMPKDVVSNRFGGMQKELIYTSEIEMQLIEASLFEELVKKESIDYRRTVTEISNIILQKEGSL